MSTAAGSPPPVPTDPLRRARTGSWVGGVCAGLAQRTGVPVGQIRLVVVFASALLGLGVLVYAAVWLVLPAEDAEQSPPLVRAVATLALVAAATAGLVVLGAIAAAATLFGFGWVVAVAAGVLLVTGLVAWPAVPRGSWCRSRASPWPWSGRPRPACASSRQWDADGDDMVFVEAPTAAGCTVNDTSSTTPPPSTHRAGSCVPDSAASASCRRALRRTSIRWPPLSTWRPYCRRPSRAGRSPADGRWPGWRCRCVAAPASGPGW